MSESHATDHVTEVFPEHEKVVKIAASSQVIGEFLAENGHGWVLAEWVEDPQIKDSVLQPVALSLEQVLATYFDIDLTKIEAEKQQMLNLLRAMNEPTT